MAEHVDFCNAMKSVRTLLQESQRTFQKKISRMVGLNTILFLQANRELQTSTTLALNQLLTECSMLDIPHLTSTLEVYRSNAELLMNNLFKLCQYDIENQAKSKPKAAVLNRSNSIDYLNINDGTLDPGKLMLPALKTTDRKSSLSTYKYDNTFKLNTNNLYQIPGLDLAKSSPNDSSTIRGTNSSNQNRKSAKEIYNDLERGKLTWNSLEVSDPIVLIELSQLLSNGVLNNIKESKIQISKISDFDEAEKLTNFKTPFDTLDNIRSAIKGFLNSIRKLEYPLDENDFVQTQKKLEAKLLENIDSSMKQFWKQVIDTCFSSYSMIRNGRKIVELGCQTDVSSNQKMSLTKGERENYISRIMNFEAEVTDLTSNLKSLEGDIMNLKEELSRKEAAIEKITNEFTEMSMKLTKTTFKKDRNKSKGSFYIQKLEDTKKTLEDLQSREEVYMADLKTTKGIYQDIMNFIVELKAKLTADLSKFEGSAPKLYAYARENIDFIQQWDHVNLNEVPAIFQRLLQNQDLDQNGSSPRKEYNFNFGLKLAAGVKKWNLGYPVSAPFQLIVAEKIKGMSNIVYQRESRLPSVSSRKNQSYSRNFIPPSRALSQNYVLLTYHKGWRQNSAPKDKHHFLTIKGSMSRSNSKGLNEIGKRLNDLTSFSPDGPINRSKNSFSKIHSFNAGVKSKVNLKVLDREEALRKTEGLKVVSNSRYNLPSINRLQPTSKTDLKLSKFESKNMNSSAHLRVGSRRMLYQNSIIVPTISKYNDEQNSSGQLDRQSGDRHQQNKTNEMDVSLSKSIRYDFENDSVLNPARQITQAYTFKQDRKRFDLDKHIEEMIKLESKTEGQVTHTNFISELLKKFREELIQAKSVDNPEKFATGQTLKNTIQILRKYCYDKIDYEFILDSIASSPQSFNDLTRVFLRRDANNADFENYDPHIINQMGRVSSFARKKGHKKPQNNHISMNDLDIENALFNTKSKLAYRASSNQRQANIKGGSGYGHNSNVNNENNNYSKANYNNSNGKNNGNSNFDRPEEAFESRNADERLLQKYYLPVTLSSDFFQKYIVKTSIKGVRGVSMSLNQSNPRITQSKLNN